MLSPICFDDELAIDTGEVGNEWADRHLSPEFETTEAAVAQSVP